MATRSIDEVMRELAALPSLGDASAQALVEIGIDSAEALRAQGPVTTFVALRQHFGRRITFSWLYALECACTGMPWKLLDDERKKALRRFADRLLSESAHCCRTMHTGTKGPARRTRNRRSP